MKTPVIPEQACRKCGVVHEGSTKIICDACFPTLTKHEIQKYDKMWQREIIELFGNECVDCSHMAETESGELCGDHLTTKGSDPLARYDLAEGVCRCFTCHEGRHRGTVKRVPEKEKMPKQTQERQQKKMKKARCSYFSCPIMPLPGNKKGRCFRHTNA